MCVGLLVSSVVFRLHSKVDFAEEMQELKRNAQRKVDRVSEAKAKRRRSLAGGTHNTRGRSCEGAKRMAS